MDQRATILQLGASLAIGGAERMILNLSRELDRSRLRVLVCGLHSSDIEFTHAIAELDVPTQILKTKRFYNPRTIKALVSFINEHHVDLIHTHALDADVAGTIAGRLTNRPVVTTLHSIPFSYERQRGDRRWLQYLTVRFLAHNLICVSETARRQFIEDWHVPARRIKTIYPAASLEPFLSIPPGVPHSESDRPIQITNVGRLVPAKAQHLLIRAARRVMNRFPHARFTIVGPGPREAELRQLIEDLDLVDRVTLIGPRQDIPEILAQTDIFVLSSLWEGLPISAIEAMAAARAVILSDVGGCRELVDDRENGLIVPAGSSDAIADALETLILDETRRLQLGLAARERVRETFGGERLATEYSELYESVLKGFGRVTPVAKSSETDGDTSSITYD